MERKQLFLIFLILAVNCGIHADIITERAMSKIARDRRAYISAECRAATEQEAYDKAFADLSRQIASFLKESEGGSPDAVYLPEVSSMYQRLDSRISDNRYRVFLYVKKADLKPLGNSASAMVLAKTESETYEPVSTSRPDSVVIRDTITQVEVVEVPMAPVISSLTAVKDKDSFIASLTQMRKENRITAAAAFPISDIKDFYVAIIKEGQVLKIVHVIGEKWIDALSGKKVDPADYQSSTAYWFTIPK